MAWPLGPLARWRAGRRRDRWDKLQEKREALEGAQPAGEREPAEQEKINAFAAKKNSIALALPGRPTWMGGRVPPGGTVACTRYGLDLTFGWSRLWLVLPETTHAEITAVHASFVAAVAVANWSWPLLALGTLWWPAAVVGLVVGATDDLTALTESALDLHGRALTIALGVADENSTGPLTPEEGTDITDMARKGR